MIFGGGGGSVVGRRHMMPNPIARTGMRGGDHEHDGTLPSPMGYGSSASSPSGTANAASRSPRSAE